MEQSANLGSKSESAGAEPRSSSKFLWLALLLAVAGVAAYFLQYEARSYVFLAQFLDPHASGWLIRLEGHSVDAQDLIVSTTAGAVRARLYVPRGAPHPPGMLLVHGIHHLGIDEPRLQNFARAAASDGFAVLTPEIAALADYHVDGASISTIGDSAAWLEQHTGAGPVTVVGVSFAGGLSLLAACDPRYAPHVRALVLMGAYGSLPRVVRFLATSQAELPDSRVEPYKAHDYGAAVFVYSHLEQFFPPGDLRVAHDALRDWLWEQPVDAHALFAQLSPPARATMEILMTRQIDQLRPKLLETIHADDAQLSAISPEGKIAALHVPVFLLHGSTDEIIPSTETLWLEREIPKPYLKKALITPAFSHVDPDKHALWRDELRLMNFLAELIRTAD